jgi:hypothetical protein
VFFCFSLCLKGSTLSTLFSWRNRMAAISSTPIPGGTKHMNDGFGNRCTIDGSFFDEDGTCSHGHSHGTAYYRPPAQKKQDKKILVLPLPVNVLKAADTGTVTCQVFSSCRCNICGGYFADGDNICGLGRHEIGQKYPARTAAA